MTTTLKGLEFDPGFAPYILAFAGVVEYLYTDKFKYILSCAEEEKALLAASEAAVRKTNSILTEMNLI